MPVMFPLVVSSLLFGIGVYVVMARRHAVLILMGVELMLNAVNLNLVAFDAWWHDALDAGQSLALFTIVPRAPSRADVNEFSSSTTSLRR